MIVGFLGEYNRLYKNFVEIYDCKPFVGFGKVFEKTWTRSLQNSKNCEHLRSKMVKSIKSHLTELNLIKSLVTRFVKRSIYTRKAHSVHEFDFFNNSSIEPRTSSVVLENFLIKFKNELLSIDKIN